MGRLRNSPNRVDTLGCFHIAPSAFCDELWRNRGRGNDSHGSIGYVITITIPRFVGVGGMNKSISGCRDSWRVEHTLTICVFLLLALPVFP